MGASPYANGKAAFEPRLRSARMSEPRPDRQQILDMAASYRTACLLGAAAELDLFTRIGGRSASAEGLAEELEADVRALVILLDALAALGLLEKSQGRYTVPSEVRPLLMAGTPETLLPMILHSMNVLRSWSQLAWVVKAGIPAPRTASIRGPQADREAFVAAMHSISGPIADQVVARLQPLRFTHLLDVGGASGTWTLALLRAVPQARATLFDLPDAIAQARQRLAQTEVAGRVTLVAGDFYLDELPAGADFAWVSAIIHQHSRRENRELFAKVFRALVPGGQIAIRDVVMDPDRTRPVFGALFAVNMLVNTERGGTFTFAEIAEDLQAAGFTGPQLRVRAEDMSSVVLADKPQ